MKELGVVGLVHGGAKHIEWIRDEGAEILGVCGKWPRIEEKRLGGAFDRPYRRRAPSPESAIARR